MGCGGSQVRLRPPPEVEPDEPQASNPPAPSREPWTLADAGPAQPRTSDGSRSASADRIQRFPHLTALNRAPTGERCTYVQHHRKLRSVSE